MNKIIFIERVKALAFMLIASSVFTFFIPTANAQENIAQQTSSELSKEVQQLKSQVLQLNRELFILEEDLLFPASTQIAIFVSVDIGRFFKLDSVEVKINEQDIAGFLYTDRQRIALEQGGIQKLYLGNIKLGTHQLTAIFTGLDNEGRSIKRAVTHTFEKEDDSLMIELKLVDNTSNYRTQVVVEEWVL
ncbi:MAG: AraC family transcriptional regulator [Colwellia sp.]|nr:AraC family transcriptional regulator [Colwellia sp.]MCW9082512.1 AraC family transcriptional regulator [Colwellia sp.]